MREIKFRWKRKDIDWKYGHLTIIEKAHEPNLIAIKPLDEKWITYGVDPKSVGEYTGLKDKNGKEIYEGDIGHHYFYFDGKKIGYRGVVEWQGIKFIVKEVGGTSQDLHGGFEVIGNIYENPELLEDTG